VNLPRASIHALGAVILAAVVTGGLLIAVPLVHEFSRSSDEAARLAEQNRNDERQIRELSESQSEMPDIEASVADLRHQIPAEPRLDEVFATVAVAAREAHTGIVTALAGDTRGWGPDEVQIAFSVTVTAQTLESAQRFVDELQSGTRLIAVTRASAVSGPYGYDVSVDAVAFARLAL
jgi:Tfp pilus assembly protein PilO